MAKPPVVSARIDQTQWKRLLRDLKQLEPETRKALIKQFKGLVTEHLLPSAKKNAAWSSRIPGAIKPMVTTKKVGLRVASKKAPHGRPYEGISQGATFRHPVFGNREVWVAQRARPFLKPAVDDNRDEFLEAAGDAVDDAAQQTGWK